MQCPKCHSKNFKTDQPCAHCGYQVDASWLNELDHYQEDAQVALGSRLPPFTPQEAKTAWVELARLETLFEKVEEWRNAGYFKIEMELLDPVKKQRADADEIRQRLEGYQRPESPQTGEDRLKTVGILLDHIDLLASRQWFKSKKEIKKVVASVMAMTADAFSGDEYDDM